MKRLFSGKKISTKKFFYNSTVLVLFFACCITLFAKQPLELYAATVASGDKICFTKDILSISNEKDLKLTDTENGLQITYNPASIKDVSFAFKDSFDFNSNTVSRICLDASSESDENVSIDFYLDNDQDPFSSINLLATSKKDVTKDIYDLKLSNKHTISFGLNSKSTSNEAVSIVLKSIQFVESSIPVVYFNIDESKGTIDAMNSDSEHETKCTGDMTIQIPDNYECEYTTSKQTTSTYSMEYIKGRGNSTWWVGERKPYKIKLNEKANLLGMGSNKHWVLLANVYDNSLVRNKATYWLGKELGMKYTPECIFVDVVMNGEYYGNYLLCEQVRVDKNRVDIDDLEKTPDATDAETISGGYLLSVGGWGADGIGFETEKANFSVESPDFTIKKNETQFNYIKDYMQQVEDAIYGEEFKNSNGVHYSELVDVDSMVDYFWVQEFSQNGDAFISGSTYIYKERNGKLYFGPLWDFDYVAWGNHSTEYSSISNANFNWYTRLFQDPEFRQKVKDRWPVFKEKLEQLSKDNGIIDQYKQQIAVSQKCTFEKFGLEPKEFEGSLDPDMQEKEIEFMQNYEEFLNLCYPDLFGEDDKFFDDLKEQVEEAFSESRLPLDEQDKEILENIDDNDNVNSILMEYCGYAEHEKAIIFFKTWISCRIDWISNNLDILDDPDKLNINDYDNADEEYTVTFDPNNGEETFSVIANLSNYWEVPSPSNPSKEGMVFLGWYDQNGIKFVPENNRIFIYEDTTLIAAYIAPEDIVPIKKIEVQYNPIYVPYDSKMDYGYFYLNYIIYPENATFSDDIVVTTNLSEERLVYSSYGFIEFKGLEEFTVTLTDLHTNISATTLVKPTIDLHLEDMTASQTDIKAKKGSIVDMPLTFEPSNMNAQCEWLSTNRSIAYVDNFNRLHACSEGKVEIRCYCFDIFEYVSFNITVTKCKEAPIKEALTKKHPKPHKPEDKDVKKDLKKAVVKAKPHKPEPTKPEPTKTESHKPEHKDVTKDLKKSVVKAKP